ncbi:hypothetical protein ABPG77_009856 [Micractinium sp. CCAP 211/92]
MLSYTQYAPPLPYTHLPRQYNAVAARCSLLPGRPPPGAAQCAAQGLRLCSRWRRAHGRIQRCRASYGCQGKRRHSGWAPFTLRRSCRQGLNDMILFRIPTLHSRVVYIAPASAARPTPNPAAGLKANMQSAWKEGRGTAAVSAEPGASLLSEGLMQRELAASAIAAVACSGICRLPRGPPVLWSASTSAVCWPKATGQTMGNVRAMQAAGRATYGTAHLYGSRWSIGSCWAMLHSQGHDQPGGPSGQQSMRSDGRAHIPTRQAGAARQEPARPARGSAHPGHAEVLKCLWAPGQLNCQLVPPS